MRTDLRIALREALDPHAGLLLERYAEVQLGPAHRAAGKEGTLEPNAKRALAEGLGRQRVPDVYAWAFERWQTNVVTDSWTIEVIARTRLLIGVGNPSPLENGLTLHHTYGVPYLPATSLKGILNHWLAERLGGDKWKGVGYERGRPASSPGEYHGHLFGRPEIDSEQAGGRGAVVFEDGWLIPGAEEPLVPDVLTPHHVDYYRTGGETLPSDWEAPEPHPFVSVRPGTSFLLALSGPWAWARLAMRHLLDALDEKGMGAKTSAGYGRLRPRPSALISRPAGLARGDAHAVDALEAAEAQREKEAHEAAEEARQAADAARRAAEQRAQAEAEKARRQADTLRNIDQLIGGLQPGNAAQVVPEILEGVPEPERPQVASRIVAKLGRRWLEQRGDKGWVKDLIAWATRAARQA